MAGNLDAHRPITQILEVLHALPAQMDKYVRKRLYHPLLYLTVQMDIMLPNLI